MWREVIAEDARLRNKSNKKGGISAKMREGRVNKLTSLGRVGKAIQALITPGVAADTATVRSKLSGKFPQRGFAVVLEQPVMPVSAGAEAEDFLK